MKRFVAEKPLREDLRTLRATATADESRQINEQKGTCLIMAGAGMCNAGRILHHMRANLWNPDTQIIIVGYQSHGTLGRMLVDGAKTVRIFGEQIAVKAQIHTLGGFSAHAGQTDLLAWMSFLAPCRPRVVLCHGEDRQRDALASKIRQQFGLKAVLPGLGDVIEL